LSNRSDNSRTAASPRAFTSAMIASTVARVFASPLPAGGERGGLDVTGISFSYSMTSSACDSSPDGTTRPSAFAVRRLITSSNLVDCTTGSSAGFSPIQYPPGIEADLPIAVGEVRAVAHQPPASTNSRCS